MLKKKSGRNVNDVIKLIGEGKTGGHQSILGGQKENCRHGNKAKQRILSNNDEGSKTIECLQLGVRAYNSVQIMYGGKAVETF